MSIKLLKNLKQTTRDSEHKILLKIFIEIAWIISQKKKCFFFLFLSLLFHFFIQIPYSGRIRAHNEMSNWREGVWMMGGTCGEGRNEKKKTKNEV